MKYHFKQKHNTPLMILGIFLFLVSCDDFLQVDSPKGQISTDDVFNTKEAAESAVRTLYGKLRNDVLLSGNLNGQSALMGLFTDELELYSFGNFPLVGIYHHQITPSNEMVQAIWNNSYNLIYICNLILEKLEASTAISIDLKDQLKGETLFIRELIYFYMTNLFGDIPYVETTDYIKNKNISKTPFIEVYNKMINNLIIAKQLLQKSSSNSEKIRADKYTVSALLARTYLYNQNWTQAEIESSLIINSGNYNLETIENEFLKESSSTIFQLKPQMAGYNTRESSTFQITAPPATLALNPLFINSIEENDLRKQHWIKSISDGFTTWYGPFKYKQNGNTNTSLEYSIVFRLAEQYLIRSEARLFLGMQEGAVEDINIVRNRAGLTSINSSLFSDILDYIIHERRIEFFTEHGHRWYDLKRLNKADEILSSVKPNWNPMRTLFPIPSNELMFNSNLYPQNSGYQ